MKRIIMGSKSYFYGFEWFPNTNKKAISDTIKTFKGKGDSYALKVKGSFQKENVSTVTGIKDKESKLDLKNESAAAALALSVFYKTMKKPENISFNGHNIKDGKLSPSRKFEGSDITAKNWVLMFAAEDKDSNASGYWLAIIRKGYAWLDYFDQFHDQNKSFGIQGDIIERLKELIEFNDDRSEEYTFISDRKDVLDKFENFYYTSDKFESAQFESILISFDDFIENAKQPAIDKIHSTIVDPKYIAGVVALGTVAFGVNYWMDYLDEQERLQSSMESKRNAEKTREESLKIQQEYEAEKARVLKETLEEANKELNSKITKGDSVKNIQEWLNIVYSIKLNHYGWLLKSVDCKVVNDKALCNVELQRDKLGLNKNLIEHYPNANIVGDKATYTIEGINKIEYEEKEYLTLPNAKYFLLEVQSSLQKLILSSITYSISSPSEITKTVVLPEPPNKIILQDMNVAPIKMGVQAGTLKLNGKGAFLLNGLKDWLNDPTLKVETLKLVIDNSGNISWDLGGNYFIKTADAPILPEIPVSTIGGVNMNRAR